MFTWKKNNHFFQSKVKTEAGMFGLEGKLGIRERQGEAGRCCNKQHATGLAGSL